MMQRFRSMLFATGNKSELLRKLPKKENPENPLKDLPKENLLKKTPKKENLENPLNIK